MSINQFTEDNNLWIKTRITSNFFNLTSTMGRMSIQIEVTNEIRIITKIDGFMIEPSIETKNYKNMSIIKKLIFIDYKKYMQYKKDLTDFQIKTLIKYKRKDLKNGK